MVLREILEQIGFKNTTHLGWDHEVWYHDSECTVRYNSNIENEILNDRYVNRLSINGDTCSMSEFFNLFLESISKGNYWSGIPHFD